MDTRCLAKRGQSIKPGHKRQWCRDCVIVENSESVGGE